MESRRSLVQSIHQYCAAHKHHIVIYLVGGAATAPGHLLSQPGSSKWLGEISIPYAKDAVNIVVHPVELGKAGGPGYCSAAAATALADAAYERALVLAMRSEPLGGLGAARVVGLGLSACLASQPPRRGADRVHVATRTSAGTTLLSAHELSGSREQEEDESASILLQALAQAVGVPGHLISDLPGPSRLPLVLDEGTAGKLLREGSVRHLLRIGSSSFLANVPFRGVIYPGSFNPLHEGHRGLAAFVAAKFPHLQLAFELSIANADKPLLDQATLQERLAHFDQPVLITRAPLFVDKARQFPGSVFVLGADTVSRLLADKYYGPGEMHNVLYEMIWGLNIHFVVSGRLNPLTQQFDSGEGVVRQALPASIVQKAFTFVTEQEFRLDLSSTELRAKRAKV